MTDLDQANHALRNRNFEAAEARFQEVSRTDPEAGLFGLARTYLEWGSSRAALEAAQELVNKHYSHDAITLYAEVLGAQGRRSEAGELLEMVIEESPHAGYPRVVLAEQLARRGVWDQAGDHIVTGLTQDDRGRAFAHAQRIFADLTQAVATGKVPTRDAMRFLNLVDYNLSDKSSDMNAFFASVRRAFNGNETLARPDSSIVPVEGTGQSSPRPPSTPAPRQPQRTPVRDQRSTPVRSDGPPPIRGNSGKGYAAQTVKEYSLDPRAPVPIKAGRAPMLLQQMREDRALNERLQEGLQDLARPAWPSSYSSLDPLPSLRPQLLGEVAVEEALLQMTTGSVRSEIAVDRAIVALFAAVTQGKSRPPSFDIPGLMRLEVQCWDGLLDRLPQIPDVYWDDDRLDPRELSLGAFIGRCASVPNEATWRFSDEVSKSTISIRDTIIDPFKVARAWLNAEDKDDVFLAEPIRKAMAAATNVVWPSAVVDRLEELTEEALRLRLADLWLVWKSHRDLAATQVEVAQEIQVVAKDDKVTVFEIASRWAPPKAAGKGSVALSPDGGVHLAYRKRDGAFLVLGSRKHFARFIGTRFETITSDNSVDILTMVQDYYCPRAKVDTSDARIESRQGVGTRLRFKVESASYRESLSLVHGPGSTIPWKLEVVS